MKIKKLVNYMTDENTYIVYDEITKNGFVLDPGNDDESIIRSAAEDGIKIKYIFITHCHYDHIEYLGPLRKKTGALLLSSENASSNIGNSSINYSIYGLGFDISEKSSDIILKDGEEFVIDGLKIKCIYTPGHTNCGASYLVENCVFVGDTLFLRSVGRTDLPTGNADELASSIREKLYVLPEDTVVYCGHGKETSIGYEKKFNMFIKG